MRVWRAARSIRFTMSPPESLDGIGGCASTPFVDAPARPPQAPQELAPRPARGEQRNPRQGAHERADVSPAGEHVPDDARNLKRRQEESTHGIRRSAPQAPTLHAHARKSPAMVVGTSEGLGARPRMSVVDD